MTYLGTSETTGASFMDYFIADNIGVPPSVASTSFSEYIGYVPLSFMITDYAQTLRDGARQPRVSRKEAKLNAKAGVFIFATFCSFQKVSSTFRFNDTFIFHNYDDLMGYMDFTM